MFRSDLDALVLGVLQSAELHGYEITKRINAQCETVLRVKEGQLYLILHRLENEGKVVARWIPQNGKPARKVYSLTQSGRHELALHRKAWESFIRSVDALLSPAKQEASHA